MELEVGMYVRYISGFNNDKPIIKIGKVIEVLEYAIKLDTFRGGFFSKSEFSKLCMVGEPSFQIVELIGAGDYVNGYKVSFKDNDFKPYVQCDYPVQEGTTNHYRFYEEAIYSIVTKEQFESMSYKVGE